MRAGTARRQYHGGEVEAALIRCHGPYTFDLGQATPSKFGCLGNSVAGTAQRDDLCVELGVGPAASVLGVASENGKNRTLRPGERT